MSVPGNMEMAMTNHNPILHDLGGGDITVDGYVNDHDDEGGDYSRDDETRGSSTRSRKLSKKDSLREMTGPNDGTKKHIRLFTQSLEVEKTLDDKRDRILLETSMRALPKSPPSWITRIASCNWSGNRVHHPPGGKKIKNEGMNKKCTCDVENGVLPLMGPRNWFYFITFKWTTWGKGEPAEMRDQLMTEMNNISLISALLFSVSAAFLLNLLTPDGTGVLNFPMGQTQRHDDDDVKPAVFDWVITNIIALSSAWLLMSTLSSIFLMMAAKEVGDAESVTILIYWFGAWIKFPTLAFVIGTVMFLIGVFCWIFAIYARHAPLLVSGSLIFMFAFPLMWPMTIFCLTVSRSVWLTLARGMTGYGLPRGDDGVKKGHNKNRQVQSITYDELEEELKKYIEEAGGVENIKLDVYQDKLRICETKDPDDVPWKPERHEDVVNLGMVTKKLSEQIFEEKVEEAVRDAKKAREHISNLAFHKNAVERRKSMANTAEVARQARDSERAEHDKKVREMERILKEADIALEQYAASFVHEDIIREDQLCRLPWEALIGFGLSAGHAALFREHFPPAPYL